MNHKNKAQLGGPFGILHAPGRAFHGANPQKILREKTKMHIEITGFLARCLADPAGVERKLQQLIASLPIPEIAPSLPPRRATL